MAKYRFHIKQTVYGFIEKEIGNQDPEQYAEELEEEASIKDFTSINNHETEVDDWDKVE